MRQLSSRCTRSFRDFHAYFAVTLSVPPGDAIRSDSPPEALRRRAGYSLGSGATLRTCRRRFRGQPSQRGMQRFLTDSPWDDEVIIGRLQEYLGTRLEHTGRGVGAGRQRLSQAGEEFVQRRLDDGLSSAVLRVRYVLTVPIPPSARRGCSATRRELLPPQVLLDWDVLTQLGWTLGAVILWPMSLYAP